MSLPVEYKAFRRSTGDLPRTIEISSEQVPAQLEPKHVLIKIHAVSLNYRDVAMLHGKYPIPVEEHGIVASDCAAEVVGIGSDVKSFKVGERVAPIFDLGNLNGTEDRGMQALGGDAPGVLRQYAVFDEEVLVRLPDQLSWEEASTLACAGVTAWNALDFSESPKSARYALLQGTGGVSLFALALCHAAGITPIITSSSNDKIAAIQKQWPGTLAINYKTQRDQVAEIHHLTNDKGVDVVVNTTGVASLIADLSSLRARGGTVSLLGFLADDKPDWDPSALFTVMVKQAKLKGIGVGSKLDFESLNGFITRHEVQIKPLIDRVFTFEQSQEAVDYLYCGKHVGKVVIKL